ncbi:MAG TPA: AAA family ATPase [Gammaproteobacteria bacterium]|nr:AAA family ATPase [Gammaproteobacteria bacterium]
MKRLLYYDLLKWRHSSLRKPLLLRGARQVGKTHIVRQLGQEFEHYIEINFEKMPELAKIFEHDLDPVRISRELSLALDKVINPGNTLLFIDEIQEVPRAIIALRYFYEEMPALHVIAAGSLVDFAIERVGVPVGRISFLYMYPMSFIEYLCARNLQRLAIEIINHKLREPLNEVVHTKALRLLGEYMAIGGMPKAVQLWVTQQDVLSCTSILQDIKNAYEQDFAKYAKKHEIKYVDLLFKQIPGLICQRFKYSHLASDFRKRELQPALWLLEKAGIVHQIIHSNANGIPLGAEADLDKFKLISLDIGLNQAILGLELKDWFIDPTTAFVNKGSLTESFVGQELLAYSNPTNRQQLYYWQREEKGSHAEVDYLMTYQRNIIPVEVKSGHGGRMQSMRVFLQSHSTPYGIRFSVQNYSIHEQLHSYPLYAIASTIEDKEKLLELLQD